MRVLVCGGRDYNDYSLVKDFLDDVHRVTEDDGITDIIHGCATGADSLGARWCRENKTHNGNYIREHRYKAKWGVYGKAAGPLRNQKMLKEGNPDLVVAFPRANGEWGEGTLDMIGRAERAGVRVIRVG